MKALAAISFLLCAALAGQAQTVKFYYNKTADVETHTIAPPTKDMMITAKLINPGKYKFRIAKVSVQVNIPSGKQAEGAVQLSGPASYIKKVYSIVNPSAKFSLSPTFDFHLPDADYNHSTILSFKVDEIIAANDDGQHQIDGTFYAKEVMVVYPLKTNSTMSAKGQHH